MSGMKLDKMSYVSPYESQDNECRYFVIDYQPKGWQNQGPDQGTQITLLSAIRDTG